MVVSGSPPRQLPALSPLRGSPPRWGALPCAQEQVTSPKAGMRVRSMSASPHREMMHHRPQAVRLTSPRAAAAAGPASPAAGLLDAAAALASELEAGRGEASELSTRLQFAEERLLQQDAELAKLQGQAACARRSVRAATTAALDQLLQQYGSNNMDHGMREPLVPLLAGLRSALDGCEERGVVRPGGGSAATMMAARTPSTGTGAAHAAAADENRLALQLGRQLSALRDGAVQLAAHMEIQRQAATAAAAGVGASANTVAASAVAALRPLLKLSKRMAGRDARRLAAEALAAAHATSLALADAEAGSRCRMLLSSTADDSSDGSDSDDGGSSSSSSGGSDGCGEDHGPSAVRRRAIRAERALMHAMAIQQRARASRVAALQRVLSELQLLAARLREQLAHGRSRLEAVGVGSANGSAVTEPAAASAARNQGVAAAAAAGATAAIKAAAETAAAGARELKAQVRSLERAALAGQATPGLPGRPDSGIAVFSHYPTLLSLMPPATSRQASRLAGGLSSPKPSVVVMPQQSAAIPVGDAALAGIEAPVISSSCGSGRTEHVAMVATTQLQAGAQPSSLLGARGACNKDAGEAVQGRLASLSRQASLASARASALLATSAAPAGCLLQRGAQGFTTSCTPVARGAAESIADIGTKLRTISGRWMGAGSIGTARVA
jgi:hypothetical protein